MEGTEIPLVPHWCCKHLSVVGTVLAFQHSPTTRSFGTGEGCVTVASDLTMLLELRCYYSGFLTPLHPNQYPKSGWILRSSQACRSLFKKAELSKPGALIGFPRVRL